MFQSSKRDNTSNIGTGRSALLSGSALTGGILALMVVASPQNAMAACTVAANVVTCAATTTNDALNNYRLTPVGS